MPPEMKSETQPMTPPGNDAVESSSMDAQIDTECNIFTDREAAAFKALIEAITTADREIEQGHFINDIYIQLLLNL